MRVLLDECVPHKLRLELDGHQVSTVVFEGWSGAKNGELLDRAEGQFDVLLTADQGLGHQQKLAGRSIALLVVAVGGNEIDLLRRHIPDILKALSRIAPGEVRVVRS